MQLNDSTLFRKQAYIDGAWVDADGGQTIVVNNPATGEVLGTVPKEAQIGTLEGFHWVTDAHYAVVPKGVSLDKQSAILLLIDWILKPGQQAKAYDLGYFYPGPAIKDVPLSLAPQASRDAIANFGRPEYEDLIANNPLEVPLDAKALVAAFERWDQEIGVGHAPK